VDLDKESSQYRNTNELLMRFDVVYYYSDHDSEIRKLKDE